MGKKTNRIAELEREVFALKEKLVVLENLRPHWAKGYSSDSMAAQSATNALSEVWKVLKVKNQTECIMLLSGMVAKLSDQQGRIAQD